jgi:hypothetical protein
MGNSNPTTMIYTLSINFLKVHHMNIDIHFIEQQCYILRIHASRNFHELMCSMDIEIKDHFNFRMVWKTCGSMFDQPMKIIRDVCRDNSFARYIISLHRMYLTLVYCYLQFHNNVEDQHENM